MSATRLHLAAFDGDTDTVNRLLAEGASLNSLTENHETPLWFATYNGQTSAARTLLKWGADVNLLPTEGQSPLHVAITAGYTEIVSLLIDHGADPELFPPPKVETQEERDKRRQKFRELREKASKVRDALNVRAAEGDPLDDDALFEEEVGALEKEAKSSPWGSGRYRALIHAIQSGNIETLILLLNAGYSIQPAPGTTVAMPLLDFALRGPNGLEIGRVLLEHGANPNGDGDFSYPLTTAVIAGDIPTARLLIEAGANTNITKTGVSLLGSAVLRDDRAMVEFLIERNIGLNDALLDACLTDPKYQYVREWIARRKGTAWLSLIKNGDSEGMRAVIADGADMNVSLGKEGTPLLVAARRGNVAMVRLLLDAGADPNQSDENRICPLHAAAMKGYSEMIALLMERGAAVNAEARLGRTALHYAALMRHPEAADTLIAHGAHLGVVETVLLHRIDVADQFWARGTPIDYANESGMTALHAAMHIGDTGFAASLLDRGANTQVLDQTRRTPLDHAISEENAEMVRLLLERGADPNSSTDHRTPLSNAVTHRNAPIVRLLLEYGARIEQPIPELLAANATKRDPNERYSLWNFDLKEQFQLIPQILSLQRNLIEQERTELFERWAQPERLWDTLRVLIEFGADVNCRDDRRNPLQCCLIEFGAPIDLIQLVIDKGAMIHPVEDSYSEPLLVAISKERADVVAALLAAGVNPNGGMTVESPLQIAREQGLTEIASLLERYGASDEKREAIFAEAGLGKYMLRSVDKLRSKLANRSPAERVKSIGKLGWQRSDEQRAERVAARRNKLEEEILANEIA